jgi:hypothetical protein
MFNVFNIFEKAQKNPFKDNEKYTTNPFKIKRNRTIVWLERKPLFNIKRKD